MTPELGFSRRQAKGEGKNMSDMRRPGDGRERDNPQRAQTHPPAVPSCDQLPATLGAHTCSGGPRPGEWAPLLGAVGEGGPEP